MNYQEWILSNVPELQAPLFFGALAFFFVIQLLFPKQNPKPDQKHRRFTNVCMTAVNILALGVVPVSFFVTAIWAEQNKVGLLNIFDFPVWFIVIITLLGRALISFITHFLHHKIPLLWRMHRVHHNDTEMDVFTTFRGHPFEIVLSPFFGLPIVVLFGLSPWVLVAYEILDVLSNPFIHSNIRFPAKINKYLCYVIATPDLHRVHHSSWQTETDSNFGPVFPIWDIVFGTFRTETREPQETMQLGLQESRDPESNQFWLMMISPFYKSLSDLKPKTKTAEVTS